MKYRVKPSKVQGSILVPPSKSHTLRALIFAMMAKGQSTIRQYLPSPDTTAMIKALKSFGARVDIFPDHLTVEGLNGKLPAAEDVIDAHNSGQVLRFIGALAGLSSSYTIITGDASIRHNRPVLPLLGALEQLGALATSCRGDGYAPIIVKGPMQSGKVSLSGEDSQPVSGIMIAAAFLEGPTHIKVKNPGEKPWIDLTINWFDKVGIDCHNKNYEEYLISGGASYTGFEIVIPGDFSSAAFPIAAALVTQSELTLNNIDMSDVQGDKRVIDTLISMGAKIETDPIRKTLTVKKGSKLKGCKIDINDFVDAISILAVIACFAEGKTEIVNAAIARKKESDRIHAIATELKKMGAEIEERPDGLVITGSKLSCAHMKSYHDHRIAMSLAVAALGASGESIIEDTACVAKTYPDFAESFQFLGANIEVLT